MIMSVPIRDMGIGVLVLVATTTTTTILLLLLYVMGRRTKRYPVLSKTTERQKPTPIISIPPSSNKDNNNTLLLPSSSNSSNSSIIIDGCNGPIRLSSRTSISLLHVDEFGENRGERLEVIPLLNQLVLHWQYDNVRILFDGLGKKHIEDQDWQVAPNVRVEITHRFEEADNKIVEIVESQQQQKRKDNNKKQSLRSWIPCALEDVVGMHHHHDHIHTPNNNNTNADWMDAVVRISRTDQGPGKHRTVLKKLGLLRPRSVAVLFFGRTSPALRREAGLAAGQLRRVHPSMIIVERLLLLSDSSSSSLSRHGGDDGDDDVIVVSDDVYLRQRVDEANGLVMSFPQLWLLMKELKQQQQAPR
jgi:hypothetical protein